MRQSRFFPRKLFFKVALSLFLLLHLLFFLVSVFAVLLIGGSVFNFVIIEIYLFFLLISLVAALLFSYRFSLPLKRVILKALRVSSRSSSKNSTISEEIDDDSPGEFSELEIALDRIQKKLKKRRIQLAQEREESGALMASLQDSVFSYGIDEKIMFYNSQFATQFLYDRSLLMDPAGLSLTKVFRDPKLLDLLRRVISHGEPDSLRIKLDGESNAGARYFSVNVSPMRRERDGQLYAALGLFHDISDLKKAELLRNEFVENASHELRTPLTSIKGYLATVLEDVEQKKWDQVEQFLKVVDKSVSRLSELVNDMLTLAALDAGQDLRKDWIPTDQVTSQIIEELSPQASEKDILLKMTINSSEVWAHRGKLEQVLRNLIGNAIKYIPAHSWIRISWEEQAESVILTVEDNGPGIGSEHLARLFERFYRVDKGRSRDVGGTGLGLAIVKHIMQNHGGQIKVHSTPSVGTTFTCYFPKKKAI